MKLTRALVPAALAGALLLTGCTAGGSPSKDASGTECLAGGSATNSLKTKGEVGKDLSLTSKTPVKASKLERSVLKEGKGDVPKDGQNVAAAMTMFNGKDGSVLNQQPEAPVPFKKGALVDWANEAFRCAVPGQEVAVASSFGEMFADADPAQMGLSDFTRDDTIIVVMKFGEFTDGDAPAAGQPGTLSEDKLLKKAEGKEKAAPAGFPTVKLDKDGAPTITMPEGVEPPSKLEIATLIEGDGETVKPGDRVYVNYRGVIWRTGEEFDSSWKGGKPVDFTTNGVIGGFKQALEGQKVGSQIISVVPAEDGGYGADWLKGKGYEPDDVMVFVLDILGTVHAE